MPMDVERLKKLRRRVLDKGRSVALVLEKLMSGLEVRLDDLGSGRDLEGERDERARVRRFLDQLDRVVKSFAEGRYGLCRDCGGAIDEARLEETPWTERCAACFAKAVREGTL